MSEGPVTRVKNSSPVCREAADRTAPWVFPPDLMKHFCIQYMPPSTVRLLCKRMCSWIDYEAACMQTLKLIMDECCILAPLKLTIIIRNRPIRTYEYECISFHGDYSYIRDAYCTIYFDPRNFEIDDDTHAASIRYARMTNGDLYVKCDEMAFKRKHAIW